MVNFLPKILFFSLIYIFHNFVDVKLFFKFFTKKTLFFCFFCKNGEIFFFFFENLECWIHLYIKGFFFLHVGTKGVSTSAKKYFFFACNFQLKRLLSIFMLYVSNRAHSKENCPYVSFSKLIRHILAHINRFKWFA